MISIKGFSQSVDRFTGFTPALVRGSACSDYSQGNIAACGGMCGIEVGFESGLYTKSVQDAAGGFVGGCGIDLCMGWRFRLGPACHPCGGSDGIPAPAGAAKLCPASAELRTQPGAEQCASEVSIAGRELRLIS